MLSRTARVCSPSKNAPSGIQPPAKSGKNDLSWLVLGGTLIISGLTLLIPLITGDISY